MTNGLIGKKLGMSRFFIESGEAVPVTVLQAGPCTVVQKKTEKTDGYEALQLGFGSRRKANKPLTGHIKGSGQGPFAILKEFKGNTEEYEVGQEVTVDIFTIGEKINITGTSKGHGFAGVIKRHGFSGGGASHGCTTPRSPGSIGASAWPSRVIPGKRMPGHYGTVKKTIRNLEIIDIRPEYGVIIVKGAVPGPTNGLLLIKKR